MSTRQEVYAAIDSERDYQNKLTRNKVLDQRPMEYLSHIRVIMRQMEDDFYNKPGQPDMDYVRKIAGVSVRMMEEHGAPMRKEPWMEKVEELPAGGDAEEWFAEAAESIDNRHNQTLQKDRLDSRKYLEASIPKPTTPIVVLEKDLDELEKQLSEMQVTLDGNKSEEK